MFNKVTIITIIQISRVKWRHEKIGKQKLKLEIFINIEVNLKGRNKQRKDVHCQRFFTSTIWWAD